MRSIRTVAARRARGVLALLAGARAARAAHEQLARTGASTVSTGGFQSPTTSR